MNLKLVESGLVEQEGEKKEFEVVGEHPTLVTPGVYTVVYQKHERGCYRRDVKLYIYFLITTPGKYHGKVIIVYYNYSKKMSPRWKYIKDAEIILGRRLNEKERKKGIPPKTLFQNRYLKVDVKTVDKDHEGYLKPKFHQSSKINKILEVVEGNDNAPF